MVVRQIFFILFVLISDVALAQLGFGFKVGGNISTLGQVEDTPSLVVDNKWLVNYHAGLTCQYSLPNRIMIGSDILWNVKGGQRYTLTRGESLLLRRLQYNYLSLPIHVETMVKDSPLSLYTGLESSVFLQQFSLCLNQPDTVQLRDFLVEEKHRVTTNQEKDGSHSFP